VAETIYDMVIIGGGPGGYTTAIRAGQYGLKVALVEREKKLGGTCLHVGCIPTKSLLFDAEIYDHLKHAAEHGIEGVGTITINWKTILDRNNQRQVFARDRVRKINESKLSLMPEGLLEAMTPQQVMDLFSYLQSEAGNAPHAGQK